MKKKILCMILCVLSLVPLLTMAVSAEETATDSILRELSGFTINGKPFNEADYSDPDGWSMIGLREIGVDPDKNPGEWEYSLVLYYYAAGLTELEKEDGSNWLVYINFTEEIEDNNCSDADLWGTGIDYEWSADQRFVKVTLHATAQNRALDYVATHLDRRVYDVYRTEVFYGDDPTNASVIGRDTCFFVSGFEKDKSMVYKDSAQYVMNLKLNGTVWRDENIKSKDTPYLYNEIATVYFTVPQNIYEQYDWIDSIKANFWMFRSSPIVVTNSAKLNELANIWALQNGQNITSHWDDLPTLYYGEYTYWSDGNNASVYKAPQWIYNPTDSERWRYGEYYPEKFGPGAYTEIVNSISWYFYDPDIVIDPDDNSFYQVASSEEVEQYIREYTDKYGDPIYGPLLGDMSTALYDIKSPKHFDLVYRQEDIHDYNLSSWQGDLPNFWQRLFDITPSGSGTNEEAVKQFIAIENPKGVAMQYANDPLALSNKYKIGKADCDAFLKYLSEANGPVVLCRFAVSDYECREINVKATSTNEDGKIKDMEIDDGTVWLTRMNFYRDVDVTKVAFSRNGVIYTYKVVSDPINMNGGLSVKNDPEVDTPFKDALAALKNKLGDMADAFKWAVRIFLAVFVLAVIVFALLKLRRPKVVIKDPNKRKRK